jgi:hypothetical protein
MKADVPQGTLDLMVLQTLDSLDSRGSQHGYAIASPFEQVSQGPSSSPWARAIRR